MNGRGLDLRFRLHDGAEGLERRLRAEIATRFSRGNISVSLKAEEAGGVSAPMLNEAALAAAIDAARKGEALAAEAGLHLAPASIAQILALRGVIEASGGAMDDAETKALLASFATLLGDLAASRAEEGERTKAVVASLVDRIEQLAAAAQAAFEDSQENAAARLREKVSALLAAGAETPPERLAQELALLAVKADVREELDRLAGHVAAARDLIGEPGPVGRKLDFLTQEFNREANTLCSKAASAALTAVGLELKVAIDQLREQAQNIE